MEIIWFRSPDWERKLNGWTKPAVWTWNLHDGRPLSSNSVLVSPSGSTISTVVNASYEYTHFLQSCGLLILSSEHMQTGMTFFVKLGDCLNLTFRYENLHFLMSTMIPIFAIIWGSSCLVNTKWICMAFVAQVGACLTFGVQECTLVDAMKTPIFAIMWVSHPVNRHDLFRHTWCLSRSDTRRYKKVKNLDFLMLWYRFSQSYEVHLVQWTSKSAWPLSPNLMLVSLSDLQGPESRPGDEMTPISIDRLTIDPC